MRICRMMSVGLTCLRRTFIKVGVRSSISSLKLSFVNSYGSDPRLPILELNTNTSGSCLVSSFPLSL